MRWPSLVLLVVLGTTACARTQAGSPAAVTGTGDLADEIAERAAQALVADARLDRADSLYAPDAELLADGARRPLPPRYAGIAGFGQVSIGSSRIEVAGAFAWVLIEYRWFSAGQDRILEARATMLFSRQADGRWRIVHAHSSANR